MKRKYKTYLKINIVSLFFVALSFISITLAWFAYSGMAKMKTEVNVKAWYIEFEKQGNSVSNNLVVSFDNIYPGMETAYEEIVIKNSGDSIANLDYSVLSASILDIDDYYSDEKSSTDYIEDSLSHKYPFHIDISLSKNFVLTSNEAKFKIAISWPLDSGPEFDEIDSYWGSEAFRFQKEEAKKLSEESTYQPQASIKIAISLKAEQYIENNADSFDTKYGLGSVVYYDIENNMSCESVSETCLKTHVISRNNKNSDTTVDLLPDVAKEYLIGTFENYENKLLDYQNGKFDVTYNNSVELRPFTLNDMLNIISNDITGSFLSRKGLSNSIIGKLDYSNRFETELPKVKEDEGFYKFTNASYMYFVTKKCFWLLDEYDNDLGFAFTKIDDSDSKIYGNDKTSLCYYIPVIKVLKSSLN